MPKSIVITLSLLMLALIGLFTFIVKETNISEQRYLARKAECANKNGSYLEGICIDVATIPLESK